MRSTASKAPLTRSKATDEFIQAMRRRGRLTPYAKNMEEIIDMRQHAAPKGAAASLSANAVRRGAILPALLLLSLIATPAFAQRALELPTAGERKAANITSWAIDGGLIGWDVYRQWGASDGRGNRLARLAIKDLGTFAASEGLKRVFREQRPDPSSASGYSFPSEHAALAGAAIEQCASKGRNAQIGMMFAVDGGRVVMGAHNWWDVLAGNTLGAAIGWVVKPC